MDLQNKRILITGANGFIGRHLAERLTREGARVRGLVRTISPDAMSAGVELAQGDVTDAEAIRHVVEGCDVVIHGAAMQGGRNRLADFRRVNVTGTLNLLRAARESKVARFVHLSTINVHGYPPPIGAHADSPLDFRGDFYSISKAEGERAAWKYARDNHLPLVVIRPGCTYGPRSQAWTLTPLRRVRRGRPVLFDDGGGLCNAVYIDNLVDLIMLALTNSVAIGQAFIGTEGRGVTWREFYGAYARMAGIENLRSIPRWFALTVATAFGIVSRLDGYPPRIGRTSVEFYSHRVVFDIEKSKRVLDYEPRISFGEGMARTETWLKAEKFL
jgi:2-alkyl-3-oxoalkanoate reductase